MMDRKEFEREEWRNDDLYGAYVLRDRNPERVEHADSRCGACIRSAQTLTICILAWAIFIITLMTAFSPVCEEEPKPEPMSEIVTVIPSEPAYEAEEAEDYENEKIEEALLLQSNRIEDCLISHYCSCSKCCGAYADGKTASGTTVSSTTCAVDRRVIPMGATVMIDYDRDGLVDEYRVAEDTGAFRGNHIDLYVPEGHQRALELGIKHADVYWVLEG